MDEVQIITLSSEDEEKEITEPEPAEQLKQRRKKKRKRALNLKKRATAAKRASRDASIELIDEPGTMNTSRKSSWDSSDSDSDIQIIEESDSDEPVPIDKADFPTKYRSADEDTELSEIEDHIGEYFEEPFSKKLFPVARRVDNYERPKFTKNRPESYKRGMFSINTLILNYAPSRNITARITPKAEKEETFAMSVVAEKVVIRAIYHDIGQIDRGSLGKKSLQRNFIITRPQDPAVRIQLTNNLGGEMIPIYVDLPMTDIEIKEEQEKLAKLTYIKKNLAMKSSDLIVMRRSSDTKVISCTCKPQAPPLKGEVWKCSCYGNEKCLCWSTSSPRMREKGMGGIAFDQLEWSQAALFICGKKCACRGYCTNSLSLSKCRYPVHVVKRDPVMGYEVVAAEPIPPGEVIMPFLGELVDETHLQNRSDDDPSLEYSFELYHPREKGKFFENRCVRRPIPDRTIYIDPSIKGNVGRFLGHSCFPNTLPLRVFRNSRHIEDSTMVLVSIEPIPIGYPITFDYGMNYVAQRIKGGCLCNGPNCVNKQQDKEHLSVDEICFEYLRRLNQLTADFKADMGLIGWLQYEVAYHNWEHNELSKRVDKGIEEKKAAKQQRSKRLPTAIVGQNNGSTTVSRSSRGTNNSPPIENL